MKIKSVLKKIRKRIPGVEIQTSGGYFFNHNGYDVTFHGNGGSTEDHHVVCLHVCLEGEKSRPEYDDFPGSFFTNITQVLDYVSPVDPGIRKGDYISFGDKKRINDNIRNQKALVLNFTKTPHHRYLVLLLTGESSGQKTMLYGSKDFTKFEG